MKLWPEKKQHSLVESPTRAPKSKARVPRWNGCFGGADSYVTDEPRLQAHRAVAIQPTVVLKELSKAPFVATLDHVFSPPECAELLALAKQRSFFAQDASDSVPALLRPFAQAISALFHHRYERGFLAPYHGDIVKTARERIAALLDVDPGQLGNLAVNRYESGGGFGPHVDYAAKYDRVATFLVYLQDVPCGGETKFPKLGLTIAPAMGRGLYFEYGDSKGHFDPRTAHMGCGPHRRGTEKWIMQTFVSSSVRTPSQQQAHEAIVRLASSLKHKSGHLRPWQDPALAGPTLQIGPRHLSSSESQ